VLSNTNWIYNVFLFVLKETFTGDKLVQANNNLNKVELKKHVGLIHSTNSLSLLERKVANALLYNAYTELPTKNEHQIHIPALCKMIGYNSNDTKTIKQSLISLISTVLEWNLLGNKGNKDSSWVASAMLSDAKIEGAVCTYSYSNRMRELCYYPEFYAILNLNTIAEFKSTYGVALYENCIRYKNIKQTPWMDLSLYRKLMGVKDDIYPDFKDLNKRVIKPSIVEVNKYSTIEVSVDFKKIGRSVKEIRFLIDAKSISESSPQGKNKFSNLSSILINDFGFQKNKIDFLIESYGEKYIKEKISIIEGSKVYQDGKIKNLAQYLQSAIEKNYSPPKSSQNIIVQTVKKKEVDNAAVKRLSDLREEYNLFQCEHVNDIIENLKADVKKDLIREFESVIKPTIYFSVYKKQGVNDPLIRMKLVSFIRKHHPKLFNEILSFTEFKKSKEVV
tara:strand:- start:223 stop:1566 length:1344 start_codon:yes stop_codon:yes gene_type:complete